MVQNLHDSVRDALATHTNRPGMCLQQVQTWYRIPPSQPNASTAWRATRFHCPGDRHPPRGAPVWWTGGRHGYGHIAMALGDGTIRSTDAGGTGHVATVPLAWVEQHWGLHYEGWSADLESVLITELQANLRTVHHPVWSAGDVHVGQLAFGTKDSDSVRRLQHRLNGITLPAPGNVTLVVDGHYGEHTDVVVRAWQLHVGNPPDPAKQSSIGPKQAAQLFPQPPFAVR